MRRRGWFSSTVNLYTKTQMQMQRRIILKWNMIYWSVEDNKGLESRIMHETNLHLFPDSHVSQVLQESITKLLELHAGPNLTDSFPFPHYFQLDPQGTFLNAVNQRRKMYVILNTFIQD